MVDSNETVMFESGKELGYSEGYDNAVETIKDKLGKCVCVGEYPNGKEYKYIPYEYYDEVMNEVLSN